MCGGSGDWVGQARQMEAGRKGSRTKHGLLMVLLMVHSALSLSLAGQK